jgi:peptide/nickel transport system ATP-binding protein
MPLLEIQNLKTYFHTRAGTTKAVDDISFSLEKGEILGIVGESGSGKSVTCYSLLGLLPTPPAKVEGGQAQFGGKDLLQLPEALLREIRGKRISMIFQDPMSCLNPYLRILGQVAEPLLAHNPEITGEEAEKQALEMLKKVGIRDAEERANSYPHEFSGGMRQRVMIAMALITNPDILLADEPTTALDVTVQARILKLLKELRNELDVSVIFITHDLGVVAEVADRIVVMYRGKVVEQGIAKEIFDNPKHPYVKGLLSCRPTFSTTSRILPTVEDFMEGRIVTEETKPLAGIATTEGYRPLLEVRDLKVHFTSKGQQTVRAVDGVSLKIPAGKTLGLVGESGCGKTTTGRAILQLVQPASGSILYNDTNLASLTRAELLPYRKKLQIIFQDPYASLNPRMTIGQALEEPILFHQIANNGEEARARAVSLLEEVGLDPEHLDRYPHEFSGGQRQRICVARALAVEPEFIVCDECVSAMDVSIQAQVLNLLRELQDKRNLTYLFISHDLSVVKFISDQVAVMKAGRIIEFNSAEEIYQNPKEAYTQELLAAVPGEG